MHLRSDWEQLATSGHLCRTVMNYLTDITACRDELSTNSKILWNFCIFIVSFASTSMHQMVLNPPKLANMYHLQVSGQLYRACMNWFISLKVHIYWHCMVELGCIAIHHGCMCQCSFTTCHSTLCTTGPVCASNTCTYMYLVSLSPCSAPPTSQPCHVHCELTVCQCSTLQQLPSWRHHWIQPCSVYGYEWLSFRISSCCCLNQHC